MSDGQAAENPTLGEKAPAVIILGGQEFDSLFIYKMCWINWSWIQSILLNLISLKYLKYRLSFKYNTNTPELDVDTPHYRASLAAQLVKNLSAVQETPVRFLGQEDLLEKG